MGVEYIKTIKLSSPIKTAEGEISELKFRKPRAGDFRNVSIPAKLGDMMDAAGKMCGLLSSEMDMIEVGDMVEVAGFLGEFIGDSPQIGE